MAEEKSPSGRERKYSLRDIAPILKGWPYEAGTINVRKIVGLDGEMKLQMRLDLGLLQMEIDGRPDGVRPHGCESLLDFHENRLREYRRRTGTEEGFELDEDQCQLLRDEALMYYHRYLGLFVLGDYPAVARDTARNLRVLDMCGKFAQTQQDRLIMEQYRPYVMMMNARALASVECERGNPRRALMCLKRTLREMKAFFARFGQEEGYHQANEARILRRMVRDIRKTLPVNPLRKLQRDLEKAVKAERYEDAARIRDEIEKLRGTQQQEGSTGVPF